MGLFDGVDELFEAETVPEGFNAFQDLSTGLKWTIIVLCVVVILGIIILLHCLLKPFCFCCQCLGKIVCFPFKVLCWCCRKTDKAKREAEHELERIRALEEQVDHLAR